MTGNLTIFLVMIIASASAQQLGDVKLVGGRGPGEGTVYVYYNGKWGIVCDDAWNSRSGAVVCRQLGYGRVKAVTTGNYFNTPLNDRIFLDDTLCVGYETNLNYCRHRPWLTHNCKPREAAGLECEVTGPQKTVTIAPTTTAPTTTAPTTTTTTTIAPTTTTTTTTTTPTITTRATPRKMTIVHTRVPVFNDVRDFGAPSKPRSFGDRRPFHKSSNASFTKQQSPTPMPTVQPRRRQPVADQGAYQPEIKLVEIQGGRSNNEGYIKVHLASESAGSICADNWGLMEAMVVCRELGLHYASRATKSDFFRGGHEKKVLHSVQCDGDERSISECRFNVTTTGKCLKQRGVAGAVCTKVLPDLVPNITALIDSIKIQDRYLAYLTCAMEENCLASTAYTLKERHPRNWNHLSRRLLRFSSSILNNGTADFRPRQHRSSWEWHTCHMHYHSMDVFTHYDVLDSHGNRVAEGHKASFCLEDVECKTGVEKKFSCKGHGEQGISMACSDVYKHDIDCQWIDITDLKAGNYVFKLNVNPNLEIPELSFTNNAAVCDLNYSGYDVHLTNCRLAKG